MKILIYNELGVKDFQKLKDNSENEIIILEKGHFEEGDKYLEDADVIAGWGFSNEFAADKIKKALNLKWIHILAAGVDKLPFKELKERNILVSNSRGIHGIPISEHVFAMLLNFTRGINIFQQQKKDKVWKQQPTFELYGSTMGIIGLGSIGAEIAKKAKVFGMKVIGVKNNPCPMDNVDAVYGKDDLEKVLSLSDVIVVALPYTEQTKKFITEKEFKAMKKSAYFVNIARGPIVDEKALINVLTSGQIQGACLDVFEKEPLPKESPLWNLDNVIITPHLAAISPEYMNRAIKIFTQNVNRLCKNEELINKINLDRKY